MGEMTVELVRFEDLPHDCKWFNRSCVHCQDHARMRLHRETRELRVAVKEWLRFDNDAEPPAPDADYAEHLAYETAKTAITERVAALIFGEPEADSVAP